MLLADQPLLRGLPTGDLAKLVDSTQAVSVPAGQRLFDVGSRAEKFWLITAGRVAIEMPRPGRAPAVVDTLGAGDLIGISWFSPPYEWQFGARAAEPVTGFKLDARTVIALCESEPEFGYRLTRRMLTLVSGRLQAARIRLADAFPDGPPEAGASGQNR
jgi:CRP/FNR family transcriptional regulator, cyclic AMP receptor protein